MPNCEQKRAIETPAHKPGHDCAHLARRPSAQPHAMCTDSIRGEAWRLCGKDNDVHQVRSLTFAGTGMRSAWHKGKTTKPQRHCRRNRNRRLTWRAVPQTNVAKQTHIHAQTARETSEAKTQNRNQRTVKQRLPHLDVKRRERVDRDLA